MTRALKPDGTWAHSTIYFWRDLKLALTDMYEHGVANKTFWLGDESDKGWKYGLVSVAAFLAQSMKETIQVGLLIGGEVSVKVVYSTVPGLCVGKQCDPSLSSFKP